MATLGYSSFQRDKVPPKKTGQFDLNSNDLSANLLTMINVDVSIQRNAKISTRCLLDGGADYCYIRQSFVDGFNVSSNNITKCINCSTCCAFNSTCREIKSTVEIKIVFNNYYNVERSLVLQAYVLADMKYDLIIGNKDIKQNNLVLEILTATIVLARAKLHGVHLRRRSV